MSLNTILYLAAGLVLGTLLILHARTQKNEIQIFAVGLVVAAAIYVGFAVIWGSLSWVLIEIAGVMVYGFLAWLGVRFTKYWLAFGWTAHLVWDWVLHFRGAGSAVAPEWYVFLCISFDLLIAGYIIVGSTSRIKSRAA